MLPRTGTQGRLYSLAGSARLLSDVRMFVNDRVDLPDARPGQDERVSFRAPKGEGRRGRGIRMHWALAIIAIAMAAMLWQLGSRMAEERHLREEYALTLSRIAAAEGERRDMELRLSKASDPSYICYYAVQELGMKLAVGNEMVWVEAPDTRPRPGNDITAHLRSSEKGANHMP